MPSLAEYLAPYLGGYGPASADVPTGESPVTPGQVLAATGGVLSPLGQSWLARAGGQTAKDVAAYQSGGVPALMADTGETPDLAGGFAGAGILGGKLGAQRLAAAGEPKYLNAWTKAETMQTAGHTPAEILQATTEMGAPISTGKEGGFRYEMPDIGTHFTPEGEAAIARGGTLPFSEAYRHPELFTAYPEVGNLKMRFEDPIPGSAGRGFVSRGGFEAANRQIFINPDAPERIARSFDRPALTPQQALDEMRSTGLHEPMHAIQSVEKFPAGGSMDSPEVVQAMSQRAAARIKDIDRQIQDMRDASVQWIERQRTAGDLFGSGDVSAATNDFYAQHPDYIGKLGNLKYERFTLGQPNTRQMMKYKAYTDLAGETEARNVQARADMTPEELAARPPVTTEDVPRGEQLLRFGDPAFALQSEPTFQGRMAAGRDAEFARAQRGQATGNYGLGTAARTAPDAPKGSPEYASDRLNTSLRDTLGQLRGYKNPEQPLLAPGEKDLQFSQERTPEPYDFLTGRRPNAPFPQFAERYPDIGPPTMKLKTGEPEGGATYPAKTLTPEAKQVAKARIKIQEEMDREGYQPFFDPSQRFPAGWENQPGPHVDTAQAVAAKQATIENHLKTIGAEETLANLRKGYSRGLDLSDTQAWYLMGQVEQKMMQDMGAEAGRKHFRDTIATGMAATTSGQTPPTNLMMTHYLNYLRKTGQPFPTAAHQTPVGVGGQRTMPNIESYQELFSDPRGPYEALGLKNPKRTDFAQAQMGNPNAFTIDEQMGHGMIQKDVSAEGTYGLVTNVGRQEAVRSGVEPQRYQDVAWGGFKKMLEDAQRAKKGLRPYGPGEGYQGQPEISVINDQIERQHRLTGMPRQEIWERLYLKNEIPAYAVGGLTLGGVLQSQMNPTTPPE